MADGGAKKPRGEVFDQDVYGAADGAAYDAAIDVGGEEEGGGELERAVASRLASYTAPKSVLADLPAEEGGGAAAAGPSQLGASRRVADREGEYHRRRLDRALSPARADAFATGEATPATGASTYAERMRDSALARERDNTLANIRRKERAEADAAGAASLAGASAADAERPTKASGAAAPAPAPAPGGRAGGKRSRWDAAAPAGAAPGAASEWDAPEAPAAPLSRWDATPVAGAPGADGARKASRWDATPVGGAGAAPAAKRSRWDATPAAMALAGGATPAWGGATPAGGAGGETPLYAAAAHGAAVAATPEAHRAARIEAEVDARNRPLSDADLDALLPGEADGYRVLDPPPGYVPIRTPARKLLATPTPLGGTPLYAIPDEDRGGGGGADVPLALPDGLPDLKPEDAAYFGKLLTRVDEAALSVEEAKERKIMRLLLKVKNGAPPQRKSALRQLTDRARDFGAGPLFGQLLPLLMSPTLEDQERHLLVKVVDRVLYRLDDLVRPHVHKLLVVVEPLLIDEDYFARAEGREIVANLAKAAGLASMIAAMRPDIDNVDEYVRNTTARAFSVVASALGVPALLPFLRAVCRSKKSWQARHTGIKVVQQVAILMGCAVLPHLRALVDVVRGGLADENQKVRTIAALALAALAEAAAPYGIESFDEALEPLWKGVRALRGKVLAAFLKAIGFIVPLMDAAYANYYTREVMTVLIREFATPDEEMKKIVLKVVKQCAATDGVEPAYLKAEVLPEFFRHFWVRRMALDRRNYRAVVETTVALAERVGAAEVLARIVEDLKDESEPYRKMVMETVDKVIGALGAADVDARLEELLVDGVLYAYQEQAADETPVVLNAFATVINALGARAKPYLPQVAGTVKWRLNNKAARVRQQAADLVARTAGVMRRCDEEKLLAHLAVVLYENLGEEYPEVLGSLLGALKSIVAVIGMGRMTPPVKDLLPRLTPILKNRHEKVQENAVDLVGRIADRGAEFVPAREWMRICFELLDMLKAHKKAIRRAAVNTFGYIAKAIGPQDVLVTLLNNLKVQERQNRVCTTVAIAIVAETCAPFTVLPALMNEYRVPELNVQNGVLKALSFLFEYIGEMGKDYVYAVTPLLEDALMDRDLVHRQTACAVVQHMALGAAGLGVEDALLHLLNLVWPNVFEASPHLARAAAGAVEACRVALGPGVVLQYLLAGLFHPARKVREVYWRHYNALYVGAGDALVPAFPALPADAAGGAHLRHELDVFV
jgi:splicing factor 3B subunit 1